MFVSNVSMVRQHVTLDPQGKKNVVSFQLTVAAIYYTVIYYVYT